MDKNEIIRLIEQNKLIVILRGLNLDQLRNTVGALYEAGVRICEVTYNSMGNPSDQITASYIQTLVNEFKGRMIIGAGTVLSARQVELTAAVGGKFIISPDVNEEVIKKTVEKGLVSIPGALTPSEATAANRYGADFVKLFPNNEMKASYLKAIAVPLSHIKFLAVGGVNENNIAEYLNAGAYGAGISAGIVDKTAIENGDYAFITSLAKKYIDAIKNL